MQIWFLIGQFLLDKNDVLGNDFGDYLMIQVYDC